MIDFQSGYILRPVNRVFIYVSLFCALLLNLLPLGNYAWIPDFLVLALIFWNIHQHRLIGVISAFALGLLMDVHNSDLLGIHAFSYSLAAYLAVTWHRRIIALPVVSQALHIIPLFLLVALFPPLIHWLLSGTIYWWAIGSGVLQTLIEVLLWPVTTRILLAPQRRPLHIDHTRPL
jgi:rod shape-determining protein MreD